MAGQACRVSAVLLSPAQPNSIRGPRGLPKEREPVVIRDSEVKSLCDPCLGAGPGGRDGEAWFMEVPKLCFWASPE